MKNLLDPNGYIEALLRANVSQGESGQKYAQEMIARLRGDEETIDGRPPAIRSHDDLPELSRREQLRGLRRPNL